MRKNLLASITEPQDGGRVDNLDRSAYAARGASRSMMISIDEMAENAKKMLAGEAVVSLATHLLDQSFVSDRIEDDDEDYLALREAIKEQGQTTPILVRPHPERDGRYMIVFGHRRARVAKDLGIPVRAVVKHLEDIAHIIAQGQENTARANLSFIEKSLFAKKLLDMGQGKDTIKSALTVDDTLLSRMLSVVEVVPAPVIEAIGAAKSVGRDRWEELKRQVANPAGAKLAKDIALSEEFKSQHARDRFNNLLVELKARRKPSMTKVRSSLPSGSWASGDKMVEAAYRNVGRTFNLSLKSKEATDFGRYISSNLESLYRAFRVARDHELGD